MNTLRVWEDKPHIASTKLIPNDEIIKLIRISILWLHPEAEKNPDKHDTTLRETFSQSFSDSLYSFSQNLKNKGQNECILMDELGRFHEDFYQTVQDFINPPIFQRIQFREEFHICLYEQVSQSPLIINDIRIYMDDGSMVLSLPEVPIPKRIYLVQENTSKALRNLSV